MLIQLLAPMLALLPERWRAKWFAGAGVNWPRAAILSGVVEGAGCLFALIGWYLFFLNRAVQQQMDVTIQAAKGVSGEGAAYAMGFAALVTFALHPLTWALAYFSIEGVLRTLSALLTEETHGTLPLVLVDRAIVSSRRAAYERRVPLVADVVTRGGEKDPWDLKVEASRPKPTWRPPLTISWQGEYFQVAGEAAAPGTPARPHVYLLRRPRPGEVYRGIEAYDAEGVPRPANDSSHFLSGLSAALRERWGRQKSPLIMDIVSRGDGSKGWHLKVESCREKPMWVPPRTVRFEDVLYKLTATYAAQPPRPFGYQFICLPPHEAARGVIDYSPDAPSREK